ncbi:hypothetical protein OS493_016718 [Desmophyllum pertusum]|uniref:Tetratricopeptide repeat protein 29 n=1 Tax=Desmophyllum pertusum TaxID=174260 RepID=A0A9W9Z1U0_9CNID|nr:hypothetical protein OS493_016718 [Desmophyllum pertusum]
MKVKKGRPTDLKNKSDAVEDIEEKRYTSFTVYSLEREIQTCNQYLALSKESGNLTDDVAAYYTLGIAYHKLGHLEKAIEFFRKYHAICKDTEDKSGEICACLDLAKTYQRTGDLTKAIEYYKVCLDMYKDKRDRIGEQAACSNLDILYCKLDDNINVWLLQDGEYVRFSQQMFDTEVLKSNRGEDFGSFMKQTYNEIGVRSSDVKCEDRSLDALHRNDDLTVEDESDLLHLSLERHLRKTRVDAPDDETIEKENKALLEVKSKSVEGQMKVKKGRATDLKNKSDAVEDIEEKRYTSFTVDSLERDIQTCNPYLALSKESGNLTDDRAAYYTLGIAYRQLGHLEKAIEFFRRYHAICKDTEDKSGEICACLTLAKEYQRTGDLTKAIEYYKVCLDMYKDKEDRIGEQAACTNLGNLYHELDEYKVALDYCQRSLTICKELGNRAEEGRQNGRIGLLHEHLNDFKKAAEHFTICMRICQEAIDLDDNINVWLLQAGADVQFSQQIFDTEVLKSNRGEDFGSFIKQTYKEIGVRSSDVKCEDRSLDALHRNDVLTVEDESDLLHLSLERHLRKTRVDAPDDKTIEKENRVLLEVKSKSVEGQMKVKKGRPTDLKNKSDAVEDIEEKRYTSFTVDSLERDIQTYNQYLALSKESENLTGDGSAYYTLGIAYHKLGYLEKSIELFRKYHSICKDTEDKSDDNINVWLLQAGEDVRFSQQMFDTEVLKSNRGEDFGSFMKQTYKEIGVRSSDVKCEDRSLDALHRNDDLTVEDESDLLHLSLERHLRKTRVDAPDDETIEKENKALLEVKSKSVEGQMKVKKGRPTDLKNKSDAVEDIEEKRYTSFTVGRLERDIQTCNQYLALSKESGNLTGDGAAYYTLGIAYYKLGHLEKAIELFRKLHSICKDTEDKSAGADVRFSQQMFDTEVLKSNRGEDFGSFIKQTYKEIGVRSSDVKCEDRSLDALHRNDDLTVVEESDLLHLSLERHLRKTRVDTPDDETLDEIGAPSKYCTGKFPEMLRQV